MLLLTTAWSIIIYYVFCKWFFADEKKKMKCIFSISDAAPGTLNYIDIKL